MESDFAHRVLGKRSTDESASSVDEQVRLHELRSLFATFLPDAAADELTSVASLQKELQAEQLRLEALLEERVIDTEEYAKAVNKEIAWSMRRCARVLGEDRCKQLFGVDDLDQAGVIAPELMTESREPAGAASASPWRPALHIGDIAPDFSAETTQGRIQFHRWISNSWAVLLSHSTDFSPVSTTELGYLAKLKPEFDKRSVKLVGLSIAPLSDHKRWSRDIKESQGYEPNFPIIADTDLIISKLYGILPEASGGSSATWASSRTQPVHIVFVIGPDKQIKLTIAYPPTTGRNLDELLRVIDSLQLTAKHRVATPVNWKQGDDVIIAGSVSDDEAKKVYPDGWKSPKPYIRYVRPPQRKD